MTAHLRVLASASGGKLAFQPLVLPAVFVFRPDAEMFGPQGCLAARRSPCLEARDPNPCLDRHGAAIPRRRPR
ncbi:hypothetical protein AKJ08_1757 [Vulgatibacter incomptus]|uniref:Uncharacterized protein n=1 Tax=Vulgatibacter incomptus TaxID=1391653 RepID=A0A0K1PCX2_9BACT|nr:hypothetical protein AKJ08_1757 [Vulgatibacter incomptus]